MAKGKKSKNDLDSESDLSDNEAQEQQDVKVKKGKKDKKKDVKELQQDLEDLNLEDSESETSKPVKKEKKKSKKKAGKSDSEEEMANVPKKGGFALLMEDAGDSLPSEDSDQEDPEPASKKDKEAGLSDKNKKKKGKKDSKEDEFTEEQPKQEKGGKKKKKKKGKKDDDDDEDLDAMLAALRSEYTGEPMPEGQATGEKADEKKENKKKGKKDHEGNEAADLGFEVIDGEEIGGTVKTAAQKKKEKKERQMQKAREENQAGNSKDASVEKEIVKKQDSVEKEATPEVGGEDNEEGGEGEGKKGKKKKGKKDKEEEDKKKKKPNKAVLAAMQEALTKQKEEEERLQQEEEETERLAEEAFQAKLEAKRKDEEKKAAKKEREKQKKAELKAAGKLLTPAQKQAKLRAEAMLEAMRAQGVDVPAVGEKRPRPGTRKRMNQKNKQAEKEASPGEDTEKEATPEEEVKVEVKLEEEKKEVVADSWEAEEIKDAWDAESDTEEKNKKDSKEEKVEEEEEKNEEEVSEDDDDESEEESEEESSSEEEDEDEEEEEDKTLAEKKRERAIARIKKRMADNEAARSVDELRAPVVCVLGHVDTGKTKILDKLRRTNVQDGEAGGITQQIGTTNVPIAVIQEQCKMVQGFLAAPLRLPGLLIIDTPGHESFSNLRDRGSSLCDIAILVVDIMHGLEPQTIESLNLLKKKKTPFVVALNKIDRLYEWKPNKHKDVREVIASQPHNTRLEFQKRKDEVILGLAEQGLNAALFYENPDPEDYTSLIPTSAHSGDGMGNLMASLVEISQSYLAKRLSFTEELQATVLEVKAIGGFGTTIDIVLVNGRLKFGQTIVLAGTDGPIVTTIKALLTPSKMQDLRVKSQYLEHKDLKAAQGVKIAARDLEKTIAGLAMRVANNSDEVEMLREAAQRDLSSALNAIKCKPLGVYVQASTLGSLEALLEFLKTSKIPYAGVRIGPVVRKDVMRASTMLEHEEKFAVILAFDVKVERDAQEMADRENVKIFQADIIYHLFDRFTEYQDDLIKQKKEQFRSIAVFPCKLKIMPEHIYMSRDPIVVGVSVVGGVLRTGTPICVPSKEFIYIGVCTGIQHNSKDVDTAKKGDEVCVKIENPGGDAPKMFGRHFDETDMLTSRISRESIDACKDYFRDELAKSDWALMVELKKLFEIL
eukprot:GFUD01001159.1.p1 GENE.GFUD01001159.1~~GFUD01001159.1.p1  ORF type:complete len:1171 (+),score=535.88 GFUD01001159.1:41-3553(+)